MTEQNQLILLVEDNEDDVFVLRRALKKAQITNPLQIATDGQQAIDFLSAVICCADREKFPMPCLMLLDLKLPYADGFDVLEWMRGQPALQSVLVVVLTSSAESRDQERAFALGVEHYLIKPPTPEALLEVVQAMRTNKAMSVQSAAPLSSSQNRLPTPT